MLSPDAPITAPPDASEVVLMDAAPPQVVVDAAAETAFDPTCEAADRNVCGGCQALRINPKIDVELAGAGARDLTGLCATIHTAVAKRLVVMCGSIDDGCGGRLNCGPQGGQQLSDLAPLRRVCGSSARWDLRLGGAKCPFLQPPFSMPCWFRAKAYPA